MAWNWHAEKRRFELVVGKSMVKDQRDCYFGRVQTHDHQPKRRVAYVLQEQGWSMTQDMAFLTDGADNVRNLAVDISPSAKHLLDWFHLTMRLWVLSRYPEGLKHYDPEQATRMADRLERIKWCLWHGKRIATSFVESAVNVLIGKRFAKNQKMQSSKQGTHHLL